MTVYITLPVHHMTSILPGHENFSDTLLYYSINASDPRKVQQLIEGIYKDGVFVTNGGW